MQYDLENLYVENTRTLPSPRPLILITGNWGDKGCELADGYSRSLLRAGATPLVLPPTEDLTGLHEALERADGLLLSGGADINPLWLNQDPIPELGGINPRRDALELLLVRLAADRQMPIFGICRGMQLMVAAMGGTLYQDISVQHPTRPLLKHAQAAPRTEATHRISIEPDSTLARLLGTTANVNSVHHQAVKSCGTRFRPTAFAADGIIEAVESTEYKSMMGVQWHPEAMGGETMWPLFDHFVEQARSYRRVRRFHAKHLTLDSHCDTPMKFDCGIDFNRRDPQLLVDIHKMTEGGLDASIMVAYLPQGGRSAEEHTAATACANGILDRLETMIEHCPQARMAFTPEDLICHKVAGFKSIMPGIENGYAFGTDLGNIERFRRRGVVYTTLCHNGNNDICDSARPNAADLRRHAARGGAEHGGLSDFGKKVVREMNRVGMIVDLSHAAESSFYAALDHSLTPIVCSHSSARALCNHPRNLTDDQLRALAQKGGVAQCTFYAGFLNDPSEHADLEHAVAHLLHMVKVAGIDHVGIGTDFDGDGGVRGLADASELLNFTRRLQAEGFTDEDLGKIWGGNFLRVMTLAQADAQPLF